MVTPRAAMSPRDPVGGSFRISTSPHLSHDEMQQLVRSRIKQARSSAAGLISRQRMRSPTKVSPPPGPDDEFVQTRPIKEDAPEERPSSFGRRVALEPRASNDPEIIDKHREDSEQERAVTSADTSSHVAHPPPLGSPTTPIIVDDVQTKFDEQVSEGRFKWSFEESDSADSDSKIMVPSTRELSINTESLNRVMTSPSQYDEKLSPLHTRSALQKSPSHSSPSQSPMRSPLRKPRSPFDHKPQANLPFREKMEPSEGQFVEFDRAFNADPSEERDGNLGKSQDPLEKAIWDGPRLTRDPSAKWDSTSNRDPREGSSAMDVHNDENSSGPIVQHNARSAGSSADSSTIARCNSTLEEIDEHSRQAKSKASQLRISLQTKNLEISKMIQKTQELREKRLKGMLTPKGTRRNLSEYQVDEDDEIMMRRHRSSLSMPDASVIMSTRESAQDEINQMVKESIARAKNKVGDVSNSEDRKPEMDKMSMARINFEKNLASPNSYVELQSQTRKIRYESDGNSDALKSAVVDDNIPRGGVRPRSSELASSLSPKVQGNTDSSNEDTVGLHYKGGLLVLTPTNKATTTEAAYPVSPSGKKQNVEPSSAYDRENMPADKFQESSVKITGFAESSLSDMSDLGKIDSNDTGTLSSLSRDGVSFTREGDVSDEGPTHDSAKNEDTKSIAAKGGEWAQSTGHRDTLEITPSQLGSKSKCKTPYNSMSDSFSSCPSEQDSDTEQDSDMTSASSEEEQHTSAQKQQAETKHEEPRPHPVDDRSPSESAAEYQKDDEELLRDSQKSVIGADRQEMEDSGTISSSSNHNAARYTKKENPRNQKVRRSTRSRRNTDKDNNGHRNNSLDEQERESWLLEGLTYGFDHAADRLNEKLGFVDPRDEGSAYEDPRREKEMQLGSFAFSDAEDAFTEVDEEEQLSMSLSDDSSDNAFTSRYNVSDGPSSYEEDGCQIM